MIICKVNNEATGKDSVLHAELLKVFKNQKDADLMYSKVVGDDFKGIFGDWVANYKGESSVKTGETYATGEPKLKVSKGTSQRYFELQDGTSFFIDKKGLRGSFSPQEIKDVSKYFLFRYVQDGGAQSFNDYDSAKNESKLMTSMEKSMDDYMVQVGNMKEGKAKVGLGKRMDKIRLHKEDFKRELIYQLDSLGQKFIENITDGEGNPIGEVTEENKGGGINIAESISVNPKSTATVNTKIFLSQLQSSVIQPDGTYKNVSSRYLRTPAFEDFSEVWETLQPLLADRVAVQSNEGVISAYTNMREAIVGLQEVKPWAKDLLKKLDALYNDNGDGRYKVYEFVQAFNKNKINYYVTEFNSANSAYTIYNATATNSRESQILDRWGIRFQGKWLDDGTQIYLSTEKAATIKGISDNVQNIYTEWLDLIKLAGEDRTLINEAYQYASVNLFKELRALGVFGLKDTDINAMILLGGGNINEFKTTKDLFEGVMHMINGDILKVDKKGNGIKFTDDDGNGINPFRSQKMVKMLAKASAMRELDIAESTILASGGKTYFAYSNPTYISNKIAEWKVDPSELIELSTQPINASSKWMHYLLANHITNDDAQQRKVSQERLNKLEAGLASSFTSVGKDDGVDNTSISLGDQLNDNLSKLLGARLKNGVSYFPSIIAADKSRRVEFKGLEFVDSGIHGRTNDGSVHIPPQTVDIFVNYFEDEYNRMRIVAKELENLPDNKKIQHYHTGNTNGLKSQLFPELSHDVLKGPLSKALYKDGLPIDSKGIQGLDSVQRAAVAVAVKASLMERHTETQAKIEALKDETKMNAKLMSSYKANGGMEAMAGDYLVNGLISSIEYTKVFSGDPAYYKDLPDLIKRVPATYTDGLQLALESSDDMKFNIAIVEGVEVTSKYIQKIKDSLDDKSLAKAYEVNAKGKGGVNTTDAQAWITPERWKFIKQRLGQWSNQHDVVYNKMKSGKELDASKGELKLAAQPLKGVYFEINNGVPTYLKYSQAVLIPSMVKGTPMEKLLHKMTHDKDGNYITNPSDQIHEVITADGIKVGAIAPTKINKGDTTEMADEFELNSNTMNNKGWKLQQDLPVKSMHETNLGSQIQKNILEGLMLEDKYTVFGEEKGVDGSVLLKKIHDAISDLINIGADEVSEKLGIVGGKITDKSALYQVMINEFRERGGNENIITALEKQTPFDGIPQIRGRIDSILMSVFNRAMTKISTEGGSYIQVSPFGLESLKKESFKGGLTIDESNELEEIKANIETANDNFEYIILNEMPKITPESAKRETGGKVGTNQDINPSWLSKTGKTIEKAAEDIYANNFSEGGGLTESDIRDIIIDNIQKTKSEAMSQFTGGARLKELQDKSKTGEAFFKENESNIQIISNNYDNKGLQPPRRGPDGQTLPGQVMIPHTLAMKLLEQSGQKLEDMTPAKWKRAFASRKTRELVGYRIPNQGMSSNDTLEIVGILPATMGDSIIGYDAIPAKTGSDFDIDKMYIMAPNMLYNKKSERFELLNNENKKFYSGNKNVKKLIAQNTVLNLYSDILQSPHTYDNMMTSIDTAFLKDDIDKLHPKAAEKNLDLFSPITQLTTKMNYMSGKMGVALTANQLVDHVANQSLDIKVATNLGFLDTVLQEKNNKTQMDKSTPGQRSIATTLSAFLNAYVDIAKDPYITRGNHNDVTANTSFMLIRAGVPLETINRYIGQPILKEYVELKKRAESITAEPLTIQNPTNGDVSFVTPIEYLKNKYGIKDHDKSHLKLKSISAKDMEASIKGKRSEFIDSVVLNAFIFHEKKAAQWTEAVLAAKIDTKGAGGSPIMMNIAINKIDKVEKDRFVLGYRKKFKDTALGTYEAKALEFTRNVLHRSGVVLSGTEEAADFMNTVSAKITKEPMLISEKLGKAIDKGMYAYMMAGTKMMKSNRNNFKTLFTKLPLKIAEMQKTSDNFLIKELEIQKRGNYNFIGINAQNKPALYENDIYRAWMDLYETPNTKDLAVRLVKYAYSQSGFSANLNQFFTHIPHEILKAEGMNAEINGFFQRLGDMASDDTFIDQFLRHESDNFDVVPRIKGVQVSLMDGIAVEHGFAASEKFLNKYKVIKGKDHSFNPPLFVTTAAGFYELQNPEDDFKEMSPMYIRTYKLGYKAGKNKVFEYSYGTSIEKSILPENNELFTNEFNNAISNAKRKMDALAMGKEEKANAEINAQMNPETTTSEEDINDNTEMSTEQEMASVITADMFKNIVKKENITKKDC